MSLLSNHFSKAETFPVLYDPVELLYPSSLVVPNTYESFLAQDDFVQYIASVTSQTDKLSRQG